MGQIVGDPVTAIEGRFGIELKRVAPHEWAGPCPHCGGNDRFHFWDDRLNWWCRPGPGHCGQQGFLDQLLGADRPTKEQQIEWRLQTLERLQREQEERLTRLERMHKCTDHLRYHQALDEQALAYWWQEGITDESIERYLLGYCLSCPTDQEKRPSYTIPVINDGHLENIRHRLCGVTTDKYRPHMSGLGVQLFNADNLACHPAEIVIVEGEKKSIVMAQAGFPNVGIVGKRAFRPEWVERFTGMTVYVTLDPDAHESAVKLGTMLKPVAREVRVVSLPFKADDMIVKYGAGADDLRAFLYQGRPM